MTVDAEAQMPDLHGTATCWTMWMLDGAGCREQFVLPRIRPRQATVLEDGSQMAYLANCSDVPAT